MPYCCDELFCVCVCAVCLCYLFRSNPQDQGESEEPLGKEQTALASRSTPLSYAQVVGPGHQGVKRRFSFSPHDQCPKRSAKYSRMTGPCDSSPCSEARPLNIAATPEGTPEGGHHKGCSGFAQRRLFSSPNANQTATVKAR